MKADLKVYEEKMKKTVANLESEYSAVRAGRANAQVLDKINVDYYGSATPIPQLASVSSPEARSLVIQPWDQKALKDIEKAILASDLGINPQNDGRCIRLTFPQLTEDRRKELTKQVSKMGEDAKVAIRNVRRDGNDAIKAAKKKGEMTEDEQKSSEEDLQKLTDRYVKIIDEAVSAKNKEVMAI
ncbi:MAG: ribosome recycling factor [Ruminococcaceae bacterium]|nr:ribosome recycling factor [Oscillospiraceae bacterium]